MDADEVYRVTYESGRVAPMRSKRSIAGKIGFHREQLRKRNRWGHCDRDYVIVKIERAPVGIWDDVTEEFGVER